MRDDICGHAEIEGKMRCPFTVPKLRTYLRAGLFFLSFTESTDSAYG
jgi:hypothetical protein